MRECEFPPPHEGGDTRGGSAFFSSNAVYKYIMAVHPPPTFVTMATVPLWPSAICALLRVESFVAAPSSLFAATVASVPVEQGAAATAAALDAFNDCSVRGAWLGPILNTPDFSFNKIAPFRP